MVSFDFEKISSDTSFPSISTPENSVRKTADSSPEDRLPAAARAYLRALEELAGCPISIVSTGPDRDHTMVLQDPFA